MESYQAMQKRHQQEISAFPIKWAFNNAQFEEGMRALGLEPTQTDEIVGISGGGFIRKSDRQAFWDMLKRQDKLGPYDAQRGGLDSPTTNQRFYRIDHGMLQDKTHLFQRKELS